MKIELSNNKISAIKADIEIVLVVAKNLTHGWVTNKKEFELLGLDEDEGGSYLSVVDKKLYVWCENLHHDSVRTAAAKAVKTLVGTKFKTAKIGNYCEKCQTSGVKAISEGFLLGAYEYDRYKSKKNKQNLTSVKISTENYDEKAEKPDVKQLESGLQKALKISAAVNMARDLANAAPDDMTPANLAKEAKSIATARGLECVVHDEKYLAKEKMGAFLAVSRSSAHPPRLIHLIYRPKNPKAKVALVGKGLTYDSGGLSLKPAEHMVSMKADKSGACAVLGVIAAAADLGLDIEIHGVIGATENMIGGNSYKPDDILTAKNGKTIEVRNTDAEGRLVLSDCLCYIQDYFKQNKAEPDYIVDFATLTGACVVALGEYTFGVMGNNKELKNKILEAAERTGEFAAELPFNKHLKKLIKSEIADICNISSSRYGGAITAALFLSEFIYEENRDKWVHLDVAGPSYVEKAWGYNPHGASGTGVRTAVRWLQMLSSDAACLCQPEQPTKKAPAVAAKTVAAKPSKKGK